MARTITVRIDDSTYDIFKLAADGQKRTISKSGNWKMFKLQWIWTSLQ